MDSWKRANADFDPIFIAPFAWSLVASAILAFWTLWCAPEARLKHIADVAGVISPALTFLTVLIAAGSFWVQNQARGEALKSASKANRTTAAAIFLQQRDRFAKDLAYRCTSALLNDALADAAVNFGNNNEGLTYMVAQLRYDTIRSLPVQPQKRDVPGRDVNRRSKYFRMLRDEVESICRMGEEVGFDSLLDGRITELRKLTRQYPPIDTER